jgi:xanthine/uracil permease
MVREFRKVKGCCYYLLSSVSAFKYVSVVLSQSVTNHPLCVIGTTLVPVAPESSYLYILPPYLLLHIL